MRLPRPRHAGPDLTALIDAIEKALNSISGSSPLTTKGDLFGHSIVDARIPVGADTQVLTADSAQALGVKWSPPAGGPPSGPAGGDLAGTYPNPTVKASVGLTGNPTAPTAAVDDNDTSIATTAFVLGQAATGIPDTPQPDANVAAVGTSTHFARADHVHPWVQAPYTKYDPGTLTIPAASFRLQYRHLYLTTTNRLTISGDGELVLEEFNAYAPATIILGTPKMSRLSFTVPTDYVLDQLYRLTLYDSLRATLEGTADLVLTDDFGSRDRLVLAGRL